MEAQTINTANQSMVNPSQAFSIAQFKAFYEQFDQHQISQLPSLYSTNIIFKDPIHQLQGIDALKNYFDSFCASGTHYRFVFINEMVDHQQAFLQWQMHYNHPQLANGTALLLNGATLIKFTHQITYHEDFYDMGAMIYQHLPLLGWVVKKLNTRLAGST